MLGKKQKLLCYYKYIIYILHFILSKAILGPFCTSTYLWPAFRFAWLCCIWREMWKILLPLRTDICLSPQHGLRTDNMPSLIRGQLLARVSTERQHCLLKVWWSGLKADVMSKLAAIFLFKKMFRWLQIPVQLKEVIPCACRPMVTICKTIG